MSLLAQCREDRHLHATKLLPVSDARNTTDRMLAAGKGGRTKARRLARYPNRPQHAEADELVLDVPLAYCGREIAYASGSARRWTESMYAISVRMSHDVWCHHCMHERSPT